MVFFFKGIVSEPMMKNNYFRRFGACVLLAVMVYAPSDAGAEPTREYVLEPMDLSSPRATLHSFLATGDSVLLWMRDEHWENPTPALTKHLLTASKEGERALDLSELPPAARYEMGRDGYLYLYEVLCRIELPPEHEIPDASAFEDVHDAPAGQGLAASWTIPHTEITLVRMTEGPRNGHFVFSSSTVARADEFYQKTRVLPYRRTIPIEDYAEMRTYLTPGGWMISARTINAFPGWLKYGIYGQAVWKWLVLLLLIALNGSAVMGVHRLSRKRISGHAVKIYLFRLFTPITLWLLTPLLINLAIRQVSLTGSVSGVLMLAVEVIKYFSMAWIIWIGSMVVAESVIASPRIGDQSLNAHLLRLVARTFSIAAVFFIVFQMSNRLGAPLYSLVAGLGVGGIAIALAAQNTIENFIGSLNLFADAPVRVGDFCRYGEDPTKGWKRVGTVEAIGLRSTRIRGIDHSITTIPNGEFSRLHLINYSRRKHRLFLTEIGLRYETTDDQLRFVLVELRKMLVAHSRVAGDTPLVRFKGFAEYALKVEIRADIDTNDFIVYRGIQEDIMLRIMKIVQEAGSGFAFPTQTIHHVPDEGLDRDLQHVAEEQVQQWCENDTLPFPDLSAEDRETLRNTLDYPPKGSPEAGA
jgi:MscS family membrane protein